MISMKWVWVLDYSKYRTTQPSNYPIDDKNFSVLSLSSSLLLLLLLLIAAMSRARSTRLKWRQINISHLYRRISSYPPAGCWLKGSSVFHVTIITSRSACQLPQSGSVVLGCRRQSDQSCSWTERWCGPSGRSARGSLRQDGSSPPAH